MNLIPLIATTTPAGGSNYTFLILIGVMLVFMFISTRSQKKKEKQKQDELDSLKSGDEIVTIGGFFANIVSYNSDKRVYTIKLQPDGNKAVVKREAIAYKVTKEESAAETK